jgi:hypothetical protein
MQDIISEFLSEAKSAPSLFSDLAKVELYIAESYSTRALIELIQNADDSGATNFVAFQHGADLIVGNDGRTFTHEDIVSLCRSGSSTKKRGAGTIGYRGIGFKSTVGICEEVEIHSGHYSFIFSKSKTKSIIQELNDVPLIRIPHETGNRHDELTTLTNKVMSTFFLFKNVNFRIINQEIEKFSTNSCIFLNNLNSLCLKTDLHRKSFNMEKHDVIRKIKDDKTEESWLLLGDKLSPNKVAIKYDNGEVIPAEIEDSVIHAFLPTTELTGALLKFNGDFSTDPSRKNINFDDVSENSFYECTKVLTQTIEEAINNNTYQGIFKVFSGGRQLKRTRLKTYLIDLLSKGLKIDKKIVKLDNIRTCPEWLSYNDYYSLKSSFFFIPPELISQHPEINGFLHWLGVKVLNSSEVIFSSTLDSLSMYGLLSTLGNFAKKNRFTLDKVDIAKLRDIKIIPDSGTLLTVNEMIKSNNKLSEQLIDNIENSEFVSDIKSLFKTLKLIESDKKAFEFTKKSTQKKLFENPINKSIKKWRSAEINLLEYLKQQNSVIQAKDVSKAHVGYDLEVLLKSGVNLYIEVKSIKVNNSEFEITNNEFAVATELGDTYFIALVKESDSDFDVKFIKNPIRNLNFEKRIKVTSWVCDAYHENTQELSEII